MPSTARRRFVHGAFVVGSLLALALVVAPAIWMVAWVVVRAVPTWQWSVLVTTSSGTSGGLANAIVGTIVIMVGVLIIAGGVGVLTGVHLAEMTRPGWRGGPGGNVLRTAAEALSGFPSIVLGYVGYVALVVGLHWKPSLLPALLILSLMVVPYIAKSTEMALRQVPTAYREGADALGMRTGYALRKIVLRSALPGVTTGILVALAIACGETAPLLYTAGWSNQFPTFSLIHQPIAYLTYPIWTDYNQPGAEAHALAYHAALILLVLVLLLLIAARLIVARTQRHADQAR